MRTLKKTLCLVLCLAMMVGLCAMGASAAMTDEDAIESTEAVAVLNALGIITGYEDGSFRPGNELTRAEGAAIMTRMLGATVVAGTKSSFTDMGDAEWAQPYVAYCEAMGIIAGYGDGRFGPNDKLTYAQFAKMLLVALGYRADREEMVGNGWEIGVAKLVNSVNLAKDVPDFNYGANITRDAAAQMAYNTLTSVMVQYKGGLTVDDNGNLAAELDGLNNVDYDYRADREDPDGWMQFIENYFPTFKLKVAVDSFGVNVDRWFIGKDRTDTTYAKSKLAAEVVTDTIMATYTTDAGRLTKGTLYADGKNTPAKKTLTVIENGAAVDDWYFLDIDKNDATPCGFGGATVLLLDTNGDDVADTLIVKYPYLAQVSKIITAANSTTKNRQAQLKVFNKADATSTLVQYDTNDFEALDWLLIYPKGLIADSFDADAAVFGAAGKNILLAEKATVVTGTLAKKGFAAGAVISMTIDSTVYAKGKAELANFVADPALNSSVTVYLSNNYILGCIGNAALAADYVYVVGSKEVTTAFSATPTYEVGFVKQDATTATAASLADVGYNHWYSVTPSGAFNTFAGAAAPLTEVPFAALTNDKLVSTTPAIADGVVANDSTVFLIRSGSPVPTYKAYTGIKNVPYFANTAGKGAGQALIGPSGYAAAVFIDLTGLIPSDAAVTPIYLLSNAPSGVRMEGAVTYYSYSVIKDGKVDTIESTLKLDGADAVAAGLIEPAFSTDGYLTRATKPTAGTGIYAAVDQADTTFAYSAGVLKVNGTDAYAVGDDTVAYIYKAASRQLIVGDASDLADLTGAFSAIYTSPTNTKIKTIYLYA